MNGQNKKKGTSLGPRLTTVTFKFFKIFLQYLKSKNLLTYLSDVLKGQLSSNLIGSGYVTWK